MRAIWSRVKSGTWSPSATCSAQPMTACFETGSFQVQRGVALAERQSRSNSRHVSAKGTT